MRRVKFKVVNLDRNGRRYSIYAEGHYCLDYPKGEIVKAKEGTFGIAVFQTRRDASKFISDRVQGFRYFRILRVRPIGCGKIRNTISRSTSSVYIDHFYDFLILMKGAYPSVNETMDPPPGTIFYPAIEVLE